MSGERFRVRLASCRSVRKAPACVNRNIWLLCATSTCCTDITPKQTGSRFLCVPSQTQRSTHVNERLTLCHFLTLPSTLPQVHSASHVCSLVRWPRQGHYRSFGRRTDHRRSPEKYRWRSPCAEGACTAECQRSFRGPRTGYHS